MAALLMAIIIIPLQGFTSPCFWALFCWAELQHVHSIKTMAQMSYLHKIWCLVGMTSISLSMTVMAVTGCDSGCQSVGLLVYIGGRVAVHKPWHPVR